MSSSDAWTTIESDPGIFTELIERIGVRGVQVEELLSLDPDHLATLCPVHGLIFLFKWQAEHGRSAPSYAAGTGPMGPEGGGSSGLDGSGASPPVFFARQVIPNACATQALLSILLNVPSLDVGEELRALRDFTADFPPDMKGLAIGNSATIRTAHNAFARPEALVPDDDKDDADGDKDAFHFVAYVPVGGVLYELDGLTPGPVALGAFDAQSAPDGWLPVACAHIQARIQQYASQEIRFNLMALVGDRLAQAQAQLAAATQQRDTQAAQMQTDGGGDDDLQTRSCMLDEQIMRLAELRDAEAAKRAVWRVENVRRRHNYIPLLFNALKEMARRGQLMPRVQAGEAVTAGA